jgi:hypothetical protein
MGARLLPPPFSSGEPHAELDDPSRQVAVICQRYVGMISDRGSQAAGSWGQEISHIDAGNGQLFARSAMFFPSVKLRVHTVSA